MNVVSCYLIVFFFKQKTAYDMRISDWSSDVCSSDLNELSEEVMHGAVRCADPDTGHFFDDTRRYIDANARLSKADKEKIFYKNALRVFSRLKLPQVAASAGRSH